ncbi:hypothetical protein MAPG_02152 [Magnaporthiopsis poae ATCC 64411]|uniref:Uncharacterized protein n=1 Tax=Magnaporthiopsis poae (strain ATCC 64411 / 73-15) TaxID=644358 RepID=A0A0C4DQK8_MAGP6|nr:hypothetical protein MAPG_02152 [Magnaporthiopsis poae ATCC 64411]
MLAAQLAPTQGEGSRGGPGAELGLDGWLVGFLADIMSIKQVLDKCRGQWRPGFDKQVVVGLLEELESCIQTPSPSPSPAQAGSTQHGEEPLPKLNMLQTRIAQQADEQGVTASWVIRNMGKGGKAEREQDEEIQRYLKGLDVSIDLFHRGGVSRAVFLETIGKACQHLQMVYFEPQQLSDGPQALCNYPSNRFRTLAESVHGLLGQNWNSRSQSGSAAEARLCLNRHRRLDLQADTAPQQGDIPNEAGTIFEILLPACERGVDWKVTNIKIMTSK